MKRKFIALIATLSLIAALFVGFTSCTTTVEPYVTFVYKNGDTVTEEKLTIEDYSSCQNVYEVLKSDVEFNATFIEGDSPYLTAIKNLVLTDANSQYIALYTNLTDYATLTDWITGDPLDPVTIGKYSVYYANNGVKGLPFTDGAVYVFSVESF